MGAVFSCYGCGDETEYVTQSGVSICAACLRSSSPLPEPLTTFVLDPSEPLETEEDDEDTVRVPRKEMEDIDEFFARAGRVWVEYESMSETGRAIDYVREELPPPEVSMWESYLNLIEGPLAG